MVCFIHLLTVCVELEAVTVSEKQIIDQASAALKAVVHCLHNIPAHNNAMPNKVLLQMIKLLQKNKVGFTLLRSSRSKYNTSTINYLLVFFYTST